LTCLAKQKQFRKNSEYFYSKKPKKPLCNLKKYTDS